MPVMIARGEIHRRIDARRILTERALHGAHRLYEVRPLCCVKGAEAADTVADRNLIRGLALARLLENSFDALASFGQPLLEPRHREDQRGRLTLKPAGEFRNEGRGQ